MNDELISQIEDLGLSNKEARVYVANLVLGPAGVQQIADTSGIKRVTTYVILESLVGLGLVSQTSKAKKTYFNAEAPENLVRLLDKKEQSLQEQKHQLEDLLPRLTSLKTLPRDVANVKFYDSAEGIRTIHKTFYSELQKAKQDVAYGISNTDHVRAFFPEIVSNQANPDRIKTGIKSRLLYTSSDGPIYHGTDDTKMRQSRFIPYDKYSFSSDISITGERVVLLSLTGNHPTGIVIHSKELAQTMVAVFELAWIGAEKYN